MRTLVVIAASFFLLNLYSCVSVRAIQVRPGVGGVVKVNPGFKSVSDPEVRATAMREMEMNCGPGRVKIIEEGYVKVGERTSSTGEKTKQEKNSSWFGPSKSTTKTKDVQTEDVTEWQIKYDCI